MKLSNKRLAHRITSTDSFGIFGPNRVTSHAVQFFAHLFSRRDHHSDHGTKVSLRLANNCFYRNVSFRSSFTNASAFLSASKHPTNADYQTSKEINIAPASISSGHKSVRRCSVPRGPSQASAICILITRHLWR